MRRRNMTDEERYEEDKRLGKFAEKEKKKWKFLQKYYHKGVFFMDDDTLNNKEDVRNRDYSAPTLEDNYNKEVLPQVLQVKNFGKRGRTKYTHLVDQDTTYIEQKNRDKSLVKGELLSMNNEKVLSNYMSKRAGVGEIDPRESKRRKIMFLNQNFDG
jgi:microfibrillar-associated protein 1